MTEHEQGLEAQIQELAEQLAFLRWKKWYYARALAAKTEQVNQIPGTTQVKPALYQEY